MKGWHNDNYRHSLAARTSFYPKTSIGVNFRGLGGNSKYNKYMREYMQSYSGGHEKEIAQQRLADELGLTNVTADKSAYMRDYMRKYNKEPGIKEQKLAEELGITAVSENPEYKKEYMRQYMRESPAGFEKEIAQQQLAEELGLTEMQSYPIGSKWADPEYKKEYMKKYNAEYKKPREQKEYEEIMNDIGVELV